MLSSFGQTDIHPLSEIATELSDMTAFVSQPITVNLFRVSEKVNSFDNVIFWLNLSELVPSLL
ncbi:hypothetical protein GIB67_033779 [Kingdonia uniflora]|uniref:Uncharacterized protein n=1 Tax=Kingdonia uniflora TaxID=39325 RepID=A0A7J7P470_9MAGN|nr:hypothetical protein GIB67_033779 [Kingdonia uniflora]